MHGSERRSWQNAMMLKTRPAYENRETRDREFIREVCQMFARTEFRPTRLLGCGGMGEVFAAEHRTTRERLAIKVLKKEFAGRADMVERMRVEADALQAIRHPNVVLGRAQGGAVGGRPFVVMERLTGHTLGEELRIRGALPFMEAIARVRELLSGLQAVHAAGIIHRDVKPENLMMCRDGDRHFLKLIDFGVARIVHKWLRPARLAAGFTEEGVRIGTPGYCSPEQSRGDPIDPRSDLYSVGVVLYALLTGARPFMSTQGGASATPLRSSIAPQPPSARARQPIPPYLDRIVMTAIAECPEDRYDDAAAFGRELARVVAVDSWAATLPAFIPPLPNASEGPSNRTVRAEGICDHVSATPQAPHRVGVQRPRAQVRRAANHACARCRCTRMQPRPRAAETIHVVEIVLSAAVFAAVVSTFALCWAH